MGTSGVATLEVGAAVVGVEGTGAADAGAPGAASGALDVARGCGLGLTGTALGPAANAGARVQLAQVRARPMKEENA
jgi:hypothetical protein